MSKVKIDSCRRVQPLISGGSLCALVLPSIHGGVPRLQPGRWLQANDIQIHLPLPGDSSEPLRLAAGSHCDN
jgi:hypothetical protein